MSSNPRVNPMMPSILVIGDLLMLALFVFIGERDHAISDPQPVLRWLITTAEFVLPWLIAAWALGAYRAELTTRTFLGKTITAWLIAAPLGALLRSFVNGSGVIASTFLVVTLCVGGLMLIAWHWIYARLARRG
jgi:hypothetical protein